MICGSVRTGEQFLGSTIALLDCQAEAIGAYGFGALADPGSPVSTALGGLLAIFVALFGVRLMFGPRISGRDVVLDVLRVGIALTLATSWPAWRVLGYDLMINGPGEIFRALGLAAQLPGGGGDLTARLQHVDEGLAAFNAFGSGRLGVAQGDWFQLGLARSAFVTGTIVPVALVRLSAGLLLALAPLAAGLLLFRISESIFTGWAKGLVMVFLASIAVSVVQAAELALIEPWLADALARRASDVQTLDAPLEGVALTVSFALVSLGLIAVMARVAFNAGRAILPAFSFARSDRPDRLPQPQALNPSLIGTDSSSRARQLAVAVSSSMSRDERMQSLVLQEVAGAGGSDGSHERRSATRLNDRLGSSHRRTSRRHSQASERRDRTS